MLQKSILTNFQVPRHQKAGQNTQQSPKRVPRDHIKKHFNYKPATVSTCDKTIVCTEKEKQSELLKPNLVLNLQGEEFREN